PDGFKITNGLVTLEAAADGSFTLTDHSNGVVYGPLGYFEDNGDAGDEYNWSPPMKGDQIYDSRKAVNIRIEVIEGGLRQGIKVTGEWTLPAGITEDEFHRTD